MGAVLTPEKTDGRVLLRLANISDSQDMLAWRNDPVTRQFSFSTEEVSLKEHQSWFKKAIFDPNKVIYIAEKKSAKIGMVRLDKGEESAVISINLNPEFRGLGLSKSILFESIKEFRKTNLLPIIAEIKHENVVSLKLFESCGFTKISEEKSKVILRR